MSSDFDPRGATPGLSPDRHTNEGARLLVVERDPHMRALQSHFLEEAGYAVEFVDDGQAALVRARASLPDLVITEILVSKLDGLALCRQLKADEKTRGIVVMVFSILASSVRAKEAGADAFLMKPLAQHRLIGMVQRLLEERSPGTTSEQPV